MSLRRRIGLRLSRIGYVARAIEERADLSALKEPPSRRLVAGLVLVVSSFVVGGWPTIALLGVLAVWWSEPLLIIIGGPAGYAFSWGIWGLGILVAGRDCIRFGKVFARYATRRAAEWLLDQK